MRNVKGWASIYPHLHTVTVTTKAGQRYVYRYHRLSKVRVYLEPGEPGFEEQYALAANGHKTSEGRARVARQQAAQRRRTRVFVYFVHAPESGRVKIGKTNDPKRRLQVLQTGSSEQLVLLASVLDKSGGELERDFHKMFAADRLHREWFTASEAVMRMASSLGKRAA